MYSRYEAEIAQRAVDLAPIEGVWLITESGVREVPNVHPDPENHFEVSAEDSLSAHKEGLLAVVHSHPGRDPVPSEADMASQLRTGVPWGIVAVNNGEASDFIWWGAEYPRPPLLGRPFAHGQADCYALVRDFYFAHGIDLNEVPRNWQWWEEEEKFEQRWKEFGFSLVGTDNMVKGDMWVSQIRTPFECHCGVMLDSEKTLHHPGSDYAVDPSRLSIVEPVYRYVPFITKVLRHEERHKFLDKEVPL